ncbi:MAG TPA: TonB-dependent receptor [Candidatus Cybelea sp.]|nr:TonB-dependent receptor [Candidatus Cybelea sp.]
MRSMRRLTTVLMLFATFICQGTWALAGVTGGLTGVVVDSDSGAPIAGAIVTATSPSQVATVTTDASGHFGFLTLAPDTYTITAQKSDYDSHSLPGQVVFADTVQTVSVRLTKLLKTIARVTSAAAGSLVKSGTTADIYSINAATQRATSALGGGGNLNSAYSAISTVPGAYVVPNQSGYYDTVHIRGGDFDQVGYEFDGVPVNRSFDNYPSGAASSLGNAEVQVYTGANPANSEGQGLAGYINQVIRTGTFPGFADGQLGIGTPTYYHRAMVEVGGATPDRNLSYYFGIAGYNQGFRYVNGDNGANYDSWLGAPLAPLTTSQSPLYAEGGYYLGPFNWMNFAQIASRDVVANIHIGIPHHNDAGRDDVQVLWDSSYLDNTFYSSNNDIASPQCSPELTGAQCWGTINPLATLGLAPKLPVGSTTPYIDGLSWNCQSDVGGTFTQSALLSIGPSCTSRYFYPFSSQNRPWSDFATGSSYGFVPDAQRDSSQNQQEIVKIQYTKNFGSTAFFRIYGYTYYSTWDLVGAQCAAFLYACPTAPDYELSSHTRGLSAQFQDQIDSENLVSLQGSYVTASTIRDNNTQMYNNFAAFGGPLRTNAAVVVNAADPYGGFCYGGSSKNPVSCDPNLGLAQVATWDQLYEPNAAGGSGPPGALPGQCVDPHVPGKTTCTYLLAENGLYATYNNVQPKFGSGSLTDQFRPNDKILLNLGVRLDSFTFDGLNGDIDGNGGVARQFWYNAYNLDTCVNNLTGVPIDKSLIGKGIAVTAPCPSGYHGAALQNQAYQSFTFNEWQPRFSGTYSVSPDTVIRASMGRYTEAPNTAYEIYNTLETDLPFALLGPNLYPYGRTSPGLPVQPPTSLNYDISLEQHLKGTDWSFKLTPFLRQTQNQVQNFYLNQATGFISGLNVGSQRSEGIEFQTQKGDFSRNGISGLLSFAYTNSYTKYGVLSNGTTIISPINATISNYNAYTRACAKGGSFFGGSEYGIPLCGTNSGGVAAKCYKKGSPVPCSTAGAVLNPYWDAPAQSFIDPTQNFAPYDIFPAGIGSSANAFNSPYVASMVLNYRYNKLALTPSFQFQGGGKYGAPETTPGIDPANPACRPLVGSQRYDASQCPAALVIPDPFTGVFDDLGAFTEPNEFMVNFQASYDVSPRISLTAVLANIVNTCWGGSKEAWTSTDSNVCTYTTVGGGLIPPVGNAYNPPGSTSKKNGHNAATIVQQFLQYPYEAALGPYLVSGLNNSIKSPFQAYFMANIKL